MKGIKIGFDAKRAVNNCTGLGNYSRLVIDVLSRIYADNEYLLYSPKEKDNDRISPLLKRDNVSLVLPDTRFGLSFSSYWRVKSLSKQLTRQKIDLYHGLSNELPLTIAESGIPSVVTIHDLIFRHHPECYKAIDRKIYDYKFRRAAENATRVIAISECTRRDIENFYNIPSSKIDVVYQGCHPVFKELITNEQQENVRCKYQLPARYIVSVGTIETRKNQLQAVKAMRGLPDDVMLIIVGRRTSYAKEIDQYIADHNLSRRVRFLEGVPLGDLPALYKMAFFSSYTSRYEGFGIPVIESLSAGTPVIAAIGSCLEEAGGEGAIYIDPDNVEQYIEVAENLMNDNALRAKMIVAGQNHIKNFSDENFAHNIVEVYDKILKNHE